MTGSVRPRLIAGGIANQVILFIPIIFLSGFYMNIAAEIIGEPVAWPQINMMSAYPNDARNGYLLFIAAVMTVVLVWSGLLAGSVGASPGKAVFGVRYVDAQGQRCGLPKFLARAGLLMLVLSPILLLGPILGFLFGPAADAASLASLAIGALVAIWALFPLGSAQLSPINRKLGMYPELRSTTEGT